MTPTAVVTGAASGIGRAVAADLIADGHVTVAVDIDAPGLQAAATELGERFVPLVGDVGDPATHASAVVMAQRHGPLAAWVNNAGIVVSAPWHELAPATIDAGLRVLLHGTLYGLTEAVQAMRPNGRGAIVNVSSINAVAAFPGLGVYGAAKAAIVQATRSVAVEYGTDGIRCNAVLPGPVETAMMLAGVSEEYPLERIRADAAAIAPSGGVLQAGEVAKLVRFLLSDRASYVSGAAIRIDGGATARAIAFPPLELSAPAP